MPLKQYNNKEVNSSERPVSPFGDLEEKAQPVAHGTRRRWGSWAYLAPVLVIILATAGFFAWQYLNDPYRTLEPFPVSQYIDNHQSVLGVTFKADLRVEADLGWSPQAGRLLVLIPEGSAKALVVLLAPEISNQVFLKGQLYRMQLEVAPGGAIHASALEKS